MLYAVVKNNFITNIIVAQEAQRDELEAALKATLIDPTEYGLTVGDYWNGVAWTRNIGGEQRVLKPVTPAPTIEERIEALEAAMLDIILGGAV